MQHSIEELQVLLKDRRLAMVADATGISYPTLKKILDTPVEEVNVNLATLRALSSYFETTNH